MAIDEARALEIVRDLRDLAFSGTSGQLVYNPDGSGGEWYSSNSYGFGTGMVVLQVPSKAKDAPGVQTVLSAFNGDGDDPRHQEDYWQALKHLPPEDDAGPYHLEKLADIHTQFYPQKTAAKAAELRARAARLRAAQDQNRQDPR